MLTIPGDPAKLGSIAIAAVDRLGNASEPVVVAAPPEAGK